MKKEGYNHPNEQRGWTNKSPKAGYAREQLGDEDYHVTLARFNDLWRHVTDRHKNTSECPVTVIGYEFAPLAIELSQWGYHVTMVLNKDHYVRKFKKDCDIHSGGGAKVVRCNYLENIPKSRVVIFLGIVDEVDTDTRVAFINMLLRRCRTIVFAAIDKEYNFPSKYLVNKQQLDGMERIAMFVIENNEEMPAKES